MGLVNKNVFGNGLVGSPTNLMTKRIYDGRHKFGVYDKLDKCE